MKNNYGFTLVEVMVTVAVLSLGTLLIHDGLLRSADTLGHYNNILVAQELAEEKLWDARESLFFTSEGSPSAASSGSFTQSGKDFDWSATSKPQSGADNLYMIQVEIDWQEGHRPVSSKPAIFATFIKQSSL